MTPPFPSLQTDFSRPIELLLIIGVDWRPLHFQFLSHFIWKKASPPASLFVILTHKQYEYLTSAAGGLPTLYLYIFWTWYGSDIKYGRQCVRVKDKKVDDIGIPKMKRKVISDFLILTERKMLEETIFIHTMWWFYVNIQDVIAENSLISDIFDISLIFDEPCFRISHCKSTYMFRCICLSLKCKSNEFQLNISFNTTIIIYLNHWIPINKCFDFDKVYPTSINNPK